MDGKSSNIIYDPILNPDKSLKIQIVIVNAGSTPGLYQYSGFDNVEVTFTEPNIVKAFLFGKIENHTSHYDFHTFKSINAKELNLLPFSIYSYPSGETKTKSHTWNKGTWTIRAKARDTCGAESGWSTHTFEAPKNKAFNINPLFLRFLEQHPNLFPVLRYLLGL